MILGVLNSLGLVLQVFGQVYTTASKSAFITSLNTPLVPLVAFALYRTRPSKPQLVAVVLATLGLMLLTYPAGGRALERAAICTPSAARSSTPSPSSQIARRAPRHDARPLTAVQIAAAALTFCCCARTGAAVHPHTIPPASLPEFAAAGGAAAGADADG